MIKLNDDYFIDVDSYNYSLSTWRISKGKKVKRAISHHRTISEALEAFGREIIKERLGADSYSLKHAVDTIVESNTRLEEFIRDSFKDIDLHVPRWKGGCDGK